MNNIIEKEDIKIEDMIYEVRGIQVMLDSDLAKLYKCVNGTKDINKSVKRNIDRFPDNFMFKLTENEYYSLRFQIGTLKNGKDIDRYNMQYHNLKVKYDNTFHDRYFVLDNSVVYHCGASINCIGYKTFSITLINDIDICMLLMTKIK